MSQETTVKSKIKHSSKSARFPSITLDYAVKVVEEARKYGGKNITDAHLSVGSSSTKSGAFIRKKASLGYYGLIIRDKEEGYQISELADKIITPLNDEEREKAIKESFCNPELFKKLYDSMEKNVPLKIEQLGNIIVRNYGIQLSAKNEFLSTFIKSGIYARVIKYADENKTEIKLLSSERETDRPQFDPFVFFNNSSKKPEQPMEIQTVELTLTNGKAKIIVPKELTPDDAKKLRAQINILANIYSE